MLDSMKICLFCPFRLLNLIKNVYKKNHYNIKYLNYVTSKRSALDIKTHCNLYTFNSQRKKDNT